MMQIDRHRLLTLEQAADFLALSTRTVRRKIKDGELTAHKFGRLWRISEADLLAFLNRHKQG
ncbi:helix-turn-helix domain-containing protein [Brucella intermedia]|uniref:helix-turn-helix domain-containing protein n=1 Tax=Brucella intermedia TaxID=94625 RepID=UPI00224A79D7|nr:helix-turn-helix domain-containing protein [Brucella intermedia]